MLVDIVYKNWPDIVYLKYNNCKVTDKLFKEYKQSIKELIKKINKFKTKNNSDIFIVLNATNIGKIDLKYADKQQNFYDYIIKNIVNNIKYIFIIVKNEPLKMLINFYMTTKYKKYKKMFSIYKNKESVQKKLNEFLHKNPIKQPNHNICNEPL